MKKIFLLNFILSLLIFAVLFGLVSRVTIYYFVWPVIITYLVLFFETKVSWWPVICLGLFLDWFSPYFFGFYLLLFVISYILGSVLVKKYLTDKSLTVFLLVSLFLTGFVYFYQYVFSKIFNSFDSLMYFDLSWRLFLVQAGINLFLTIIIYSVTLFFTKRLRLDLLTR
jgi:hypothetical protein